MLNSFSFGDRLVNTLILLETASILGCATLWCKLRHRETDRGDVGRILALNIMRRRFAIQKRIFYKSSNYHYPPECKGAR